jgi:competence ComEA-like helix-hairpin-helix protein
MVILVMLIMLVLATPYVYQLFHKDTPISDIAFKAAVARLERAKKDYLHDNPTTTGTTDNVVKSTFNQYPPKIRPGEYVELNGADSSKLTRIRGVGPSFARRIINYRERLGGFYSKEQLKEVFGLDSLKYAGISSQVKVDPSRIRKIDINTVNIGGTGHLPYLSYKQMNAVVQYRAQHGDYTSVTDLENIAILDRNIIHKIQPYLIFKNGRTAN